MIVIVYDYDNNSRDDHDYDDDDNSDIGGMNDIMISRSTNIYYN